MTYKKKLTLSQPSRQIKVPAESNLASISQILKYATKLDYVYIFVGLFGAILAGVNWPMLTIVFGIIVDVFVDFENNKDQATEDFMKDVYFYSGFTLLISVLFVLGNYLTIYCFQMFALRLIKNVKRIYFESILKQEIAWYDQQNSGEFASRISSDFKKFENGLNENLGLLIYNATAAFINLIVGFFYGWKLSLVILAMSPINVIASVLMTKFQAYYMKKELQSYSVASSAAEEAISAIRTVFAFGGQQKERKRYKNMLDPAMKNGCKRNFVTALGNAVNWCSLYLALALGIWYGVHLIVNESYTIGQVVIVFWGITGCGYNIGYAAPYYESFQNGRSAAKAIYQVIERRSVIDSSSIEGQKLPREHKTDIEFKDVHFSYPTRPDVPILNGLNLKIKSGEIVALVGSSGCGKSTTIQLIQRFYDPNKGEILLDGHNIKNLNIGWLREQLGVVGQEPVLFDASIEENIRLGMAKQQMSQITQEDIERAAVEANAHEFISKLPEKYKTHVGDRGTQLSGGQKQRIAIARALISKPKILLLDEATSALDLQSEHVVQAALDRASQGRTTIIIAHRLSTIINADRIIFLDGGKVVEMGTHKELMELEKNYYNLVRAQQVEASEPGSYEPKYRKNTLPDPRRAASTMGSDTSSLALLNSFKYDEISAEELKELKRTKFPHFRLLKLIWGDKFYFVIAFVSALLYGLVTPIYAILFGDFVNIFTEIEEDKLTTETMPYVYYFIALAIGILIVCTLQIALFGIVGEKLTKKLRMMAYSAILNQEIAWFDDVSNSAGALCARLANDAANVQGATGLRIAMMCQAISTLISSIIVGFMYNWQMSVVSLLLMPLIAVAAIISSSIYSAQAGTDSESAEKASKVVIEVMNAVRTVVSLHKEHYFFAKFNDTLIKHYQTVKVKCFFKSMMISISLGAPFFAYTITFMFGGYLIGENILKSGDFFKIVESMVFGAMVVGQTAVLSSDYTKAKLAAMNIFKLIDRKPIKLYSEEDAVVNKSTSERCEGNISFRGIHFKYPTRPNVPILNGLSFSAHKGETVALVGSSGCGKSTTIKLLERFYDCNKGKVNLDGENIARLNVDWVRSQMSLVSQEPILFSYSIRDNIAYGDNSRTVEFEEIVKAAQMANVHGFIQKLPQGYDTPVGSKGTQLSGGQKQRIAIARALVRDPPILLLDEATSALDTASEKVVQEALDEASKGRTCIVIAHRLKTILNSNKIVVIHKGQNIEEGTHEELLAQKGHYWKLYNSAVPSS